MSPWAPLGSLGFPWAPLGSQGRIPHKPGGNMGMAGLGFPAPACQLSWELQCVSVQTVCKRPPVAVTLVRTPGKHLHVQWVLVRFPGNLGSPWVPWLFRFPAVAPRGNPQKPPTGVDPDGGSLPSPIPAALCRTPYSGRFWWRFGAAPFGSLQFPSKKACFSIHGTRGAPRERRVPKKKSHH